MSEIIENAKEDIRQMTILLQTKKDEMDQSKIKEKFFLLEKKIEKICREDFSEASKLDLLEALKKLLKRTHLTTRK